MLQMMGLIRTFLQKNNKNLMTEASLSNVNRCDASDLLNQLGGVSLPVFEIFSFM
jgi:hypothetical protein